MKEDLIKYGMLRKEYSILSSIEMLLLVLGIVSISLSTIGLFFSQTLFAVGFVSLGIEVIPVIPIVTRTDNLRWKIANLKSDLRIED